MILFFPVHGSGYAWSPSVLNVSVGDTVTWRWQAHPFLKGIGYRVFSVSSAGSVIYDGKGFTNGRQKSPSGMFLFRWITHCDCDKNFFRLKILFMQIKYKYVLHGLVGMLLLYI